LLIHYWGVGMAMVRYLIVRTIWLLLIFVIIFLITYYAARVSHLVIWTRGFTLWEILQIVTEEFSEFMNDLLFGVVEQRQSSENVREQFVRTAPVSLFLVSVAFVYSFIVGMMLGVFSAMYPKSLFDNVVSSITLFFASIPAYLWVIGLMVYFTWQRDWLPGIYPNYPTDLGPPPLSLQALGLIIPVVALSFYPIANFAQLLRAELIEQSTSETMLLAKAKGLTPKRAMLKHLLPNSFIPLIRQLPNMFTFMLFNAFLVEVAYNVPGVARWLFDSMYHRSFKQFFMDPPVVVTVSMFYATLMITMTFISDFLYALIDPRIHIHSKK